MWKTMLTQGWRNLRRNTRRTAITVGVICVGLATMIIAYGVVEGFGPQIIEGGARTLNGHILIHRTGYHRKKSLTLAMAQPDRVASLLAQEPRIEAWSRRIEARGLLGSAEGVQGVKLLGVEPAQDRKLIKLYQRITQGRAPRKGRASKRLAEIILGHNIADKLKVSVGEKVVLRVGTWQGGATSVPMRVSGIFATGSPGFDSFYVVVHRSDAARFLQMQQRAHQFAILVKQLEDVDPVVASLTAKLNPDAAKEAPYEVLPWWKTAPEIKAMADMTSASIGIMLLLIFPIVLLGCLNTMFMSAHERSREIGIIKALGTKKKHIISLFFWEALFMSLIGVAIGVAIGLGANIYFELSGGISIKPLMSDSETKFMVSGVAMDPVMWVRTSAKVVLIPAISVILSTVLAALYPAWKVARLVPARAIQFQS